MNAIFSVLASLKMFCNEIVSLVLRNTWMIKGWIKVKYKFQFNFGRFNELHTIACLPPPQGRLIGFNFSNVLNM